jgi:hypothetical protein
VRGLLPQEKNTRPLCTGRLILVFLYVPMEEREREAVLCMYVEVPILMGSPEGLGKYPWVAFPQGKEILLLFFLYVLVSHQGMKKRSHF